MKASVVTLAFFSAAAIANPVAVEKREIEPRALNLAPVLGGITGGTGLGNLGNVAVITSALNPADVVPAVTTLVQTILNILATLRAGFPNSGLGPITTIPGVPNLTTPVSAITDGTQLSPEQFLALAFGLQNALGNLTAVGSNLPVGGILGGGLNAGQLTSVQSGIAGVQNLLGPLLSSGGTLTNLGGLGGVLGGGLPNLGPLQTLFNALAPVLSVVTGLLGLVTGLLGGGLLGGGIGL